MPIFELTVLRNERPLRREQIRATGDEAAAIQALLRLASCRPGESLLLERDGSTRRMFGPKRAP